MSTSLPKWAETLKEFNSKPNPNDDGLNYRERLGLETTKLFDPAPSKDIKLKEIPKFFNPNSAKHKNDENKNAKTESMIAVAEITRDIFLDNQEEKLLSEHDLDCLFNNMVDLIKQYSNTSNYATRTNHNDILSNCWMNYEVFRELKQSLPSRAHKFFTPSVFRKFPLNSNGELRGITFHQFVSLSVNLLHQYITLCRYDISSNIISNDNNNPFHGKSYLTESDLEIFVSDQIEMIPSLNRVDEAFHPYYIYHAVRKFIFSLIPDIDNNTKQIAVVKILCSDAFREFNEFRFSSQNLLSLDDKNKNEQEILEEMMQQEMTLCKNNWFSCENALRVYKMYLELDVDHNGTLSQKEMLQFNGSSLSNLCIQRIFQYKKTWDQEMDYKGFLNFVLAQEYKQHVSALHYWWDILDLDGNGYLTPLTIHTLFRSVQKKMGIFGIDPINCEDVLNEIIDMVHPKDMIKITKQDLINSKMYNTVIDILTDVKGFWEYDNRESMVADQQN